MPGESRGPEQGAAGDEARAFAALIEAIEMHTSTGREEMALIAAAKAYRRAALRSAPPGEGNVSERDQPESDAILARAEAAYRAVIALPGQLGPEVCNLVESHYALASALSAARARADQAEQKFANAMKCNDLLIESAELIAATARRAALEEAARAAETHGESNSMCDGGIDCWHTIAAEVRALAAPEEQASREDPPTPIND